MKLTIELTPEQYASLEAIACRVGKTPKELASLRLQHSLRTPQEQREAVHRALVEAGLVRDVERPPMNPAAKRDRFMTAPIQGKPISETIIEERR